MSTQVGSRVRGPDGKNTAKKVKKKNGKASKFLGRKAKVKSKDLLDGGGQPGEVEYFVWHIPVTDVVAGDNLHVENKEAIHYVTAVDRQMVDVIPGDPQVNAVILHTELSEVRFGNQKKRDGSRMITDLAARTYVLRTTEPPAAFKPPRPS